MSILNGGSFVGSALGAGLTSYLGVTSDDFSNLFTLVLLCNLSTLLPAPFLGLLPASVEQDTPPPGGDGGDGSSSVSEAAAAGAVPAAGSSSGGHGAPHPPTAQQASREAGAQPRGAPAHGDGAPGPQSEPLKRGQRS